MSELSNIIDTKSDTYQKIGTTLPWLKRLCWHTFFAGYQSTRIAIMVVQVICRSRLWAYSTMAMSLLNTYFGLICVGIISYYAIRKPEKVSFNNWIYIRIFIFKIRPFQTEERIMMKMMLWWIILQLQSI